MDKNYTTYTTTNENEDTAKEKADTPRDETEEGSLLDIVSHSLQGLNLPAELRGKYGQDAAFKPIIAKPNKFQNFEVDGHLVYLKKSNTRLLCIPKILIQE